MYFFVVTPAMKSIDNCLEAVSKAKTESFLGAIPSVFLVILSPTQSGEVSEEVTQRLAKKSIIVLLEKKTDSSLRSE